jgi:hypothetical protein
LGKTISQQLKPKTYFVVHDKCFNAFALTGRMYPPLPTQGVAPGYWFIGLSGRPNVNPKLLFLIEYEYYLSLNS